VVLMNREDLAERGLAPRQAVDLTSHFRGATRTAQGFVALPYDIPRGCACAYFPEANVLVPLDQVAHTSGTPASKSVVITVAPARR
jgi:anaerobic selenocysteine-containing dehydrogenase